MKRALLLIVLIWMANFVVAQTYLFEDFESGSLPNWSSSSCWIYGDSTNNSSSNLKFPEHTKFIAVNDDKDENAISKGDLITPLIDLRSASHVVFSFDLYFLAYDVEEFTISIKEKNSDWKKYPVLLEGCTCWRKVFLDLSEFHGKEINIKFEYSDGDNWNYGVGIDNVKVKEADQIGGFFYRIDPVEKRIANKYDIEYKIGFCSIGYSPLSGYEILLTDGDVKNLSYLSEISFFDSIEINISNLDIGKYHFSPSLIKGDKEILTGPKINFELFPSVIPYIHDDIDGNSFDLYQSLRSGVPNLLYFTTTWCSDCKDYIPKLNDLKEEFPNLNIVSIYLDEEATDQAIKNQNLDENFSSYSFSLAGFKSYSLLSQKLESTIPFTALICPNEFQPEWSEVVWSSDSWGPGTSVTIKAYLNFCHQVTSNIESNIGDISILPNPSDGLIEVSIDNIDLNENVYLEVYNLFGQLIPAKSNINENQILLDLSALKGLYILKIKVGDRVVTRKIEIF